MRGSRETRRGRGLDTRCYLLSVRLFSRASVATGLMLGSVAALDRFILCPGFENSDLVESMIHCPANAMLNAVDRVRSMYMYRGPVVAFKLRLSEALLLSQA